MAPMEVWNMAGARAESALTATALILSLGAVVCALCVCVLSMLLASQQLRLALMSRGRERVRKSFFSAVTAGSGVWATHFLAMLGCVGVMGVKFDLTLTVVSAVFVVLALAAAWRVELRAPRQSLSPVSGLLMTVAVGGMHFVGLLAGQGAISCVPSPQRGVAALVVGFVGFYLGVIMFRRRKGASRLLSTLPWVLGVLGLHFTALSSPSLAAMEMIRDAPPSRDAVSLIYMVGVGTFLFLLLAFWSGVREYRRKRDIADEHARAHEFAEATVEGLLIVDEGRIVDANGAFRRLAGWSKSAGGQLADSFPDLTLESAFVAPNERDRSYETNLVGEGRRRIPVEVFVRSVTWRGKRRTVLAVLDLRARKAAEERVRSVSNQDLLTGLANRNALVARLKDFLLAAREKRASVILLLADVDRFKAINEAQGYAVGDAVLRQVGRALDRAAPPSALVARVSGDEFAVACVAPPDEAAAGEVVASIARALRDEFAAAREDRPITSTCIGYAIVNGVDWASESAMLHHAAIALLQAKMSGKGSIKAYDNNFDLTLQKRAKMEGELRLALERRELFLEYQPILESATRKVTGYEALVRWMHPLRGRVPPDEFIGVAEEYGLIGDLGRWVIDTACAEAASWGNDMSISVNVSPLQFQTSDIESVIGRALRQTRLSAGRLNIEITESTFLQQGEENIEILRRVHAAGVGIVMDDFGTGYSSLSYLRRFPFDKVKIDRSFIRDMLTNNQAAAIVDAVLSLGRGLGVDIVAEGIETHEQFDYLAERACSLMQGYYIGRPAPKVLKAFEMAL
ncbi:diguanylate cyclase [Acetobacter nitrogenifigens DSM 23921 = NBRC 105050]|uniref:Diguanylate cyclase n=2 Tax=Acetobacter nitrogenifigens TaxID=285268 RepID=A0A511XDF4_9PROT|nr:diguanylate cyclase [Acetobacter nitrogenifigens DSM 23921 = NBRC 105050]